MGPNTDIDSDSTGTAELITMTSELLAEADDLACPSVSGFVEFMIDRWPDRSAGSRP